MTDTTNPNIQFKVVSDSSQAQADLRRMDNSLSKVENRAESTAASLASLASRLATAFAGATVVAGIAKTSDAFLNLQNRLKLVTDSTQQLVSLQDEIISLSNATRSSVDATSSVYASFAKSVKDSQSGILGVSKTVQQAVALSGASGDSAQAALFQLSQGLQSGTLRGEELNSVLEQTPALARAIAAGMGKSLGELRSMAADGDLTTSVVYSALQKQAEVVNAEFNKTSITIGQARRNLAQAATTVAGETFVTVGLSAKLAASSDNLSKKLLANKDAIVNSVALSSLSVKSFYSDVNRLVGAFSPLFDVLGTELERMVPVIKFMRLNASQIFNVAALTQYGILTRYLNDQLVSLMGTSRNVLAMLGVDFKPDFFIAMREVIQSKNIPELEARLASLAKVIESPTGLGFFKDFGKVLQGDTDLLTAMLDAISIGPDNIGFRAITESALELRQFAATLGLVGNKLVVIGNVRIDKLMSLADYFEEISKLAKRSLPYALTDSIAAIQKFTLAVSSYFLEVSRNTSGLASVIFKALGRAGFAMAGFSASTDRVARGIYNTLKTVGLQWMVTGALTTKVGSLIKSAFLNALLTVQNLEKAMRGLGSAMSSLSGGGLSKAVSDITTLLRVGITSFIFDRMVDGVEKTAAAFDFLRSKLSVDINDIEGSFTRFEKLTERVFMESMLGDRANDVAKVFALIGREATRATPALERMRNILGNGLVGGLTDVFGEKLIKSSAEAVYYYYDSAINMLDKVSSMTSAKLAQISKVIERFATKVKLLFFDIYDKVVGHSYWPDMIQGIIDWSNKLDKEALTTVEKFTRKIGKAFKSISSVDIANPFGSNALFSIDPEAVQNGIRTLAGAVALGVFTAIFAPTLFAAMGTFLAFEIAKSVAVGADKFINKVFNVSTFEELGRSIGAAAGALIKTMVAQIPDMFNAVMQFSNGFLNQFLAEFGVLGSAIKGIANLVTGGNIGLLPIMLFGAMKADGLLKSISSIFGETSKVADAAKKAASGGGIVPAFVGKIDTKFAMAAIVALMSAASSEISIFKAAVTAAPLMLVAFLGTDVTGKLIIDTVGKVLTKITASIATSTAAGGLVGRILERTFGSNGAAVSAVASRAAGRAKSVIETVFGVMSKVTDEENRKAYLSNKKSFSDFAFGPQEPKMQRTSNKDPYGRVTLKMTEVREEQANASKATFSWMSDMKAKVKNAGSILKDALFGGTGVGGMKSAFTDTIRSTAEMAKNATSIAANETVMSKVVGLNSAVLTSNLAAATTSISGTVSTLSAVTDKAAGKGGLLSKLFFGKAGAAVTILLISNLIAKTAEAGVKDVASKAMDYLGTGLELGFIGAAILGTSAGRGAIAAIGRTIMTVLGFLSQFRVVGVVVKSFIAFWGVLTSITGAISAAAAAMFSLVGVLVTVAGFSLYSVFFGEGEGWLDRMANNFKSIVNSLTTIAGFGDIFPDEKATKPLKLATEKSTLNAAKSISLIDAGISKDVENRIGGINFSTLTQAQAKQLQSYNKMITEQVSLAKNEIKELGEVQESTVSSIKDITDKQEKMLLKLKKNQSKSLMGDVIKLQTQIEAPTNTQAKGFIDSVIASLQKVAAATPIKIMFPSLSVLFGVGTTVGKNAIDEQIDAVIKSTLVRRGDLKGAYAKVASDLAFAFEKIGDDAPLLDVEKYNKPLTELTAGVANAIKTLQDAEENTGFWQKLGFNVSNDANIVKATEDLYKATAALDAFSGQIRKTAQRQLEVNTFQNSITATEEALKKLSITANRDDLLNNKKALSLNNYIKTLQELETQLKNTASAEEAGPILVKMKVNLAEIDTNLKSAEVRGTVKEEIEGLLKDANISGVDWQQILSLKPDVRARVLKELGELGDKVKSVTTIDKNAIGAFGTAAVQSNAILVSQQAITGVINANVIAAESFATKMMTGAAASADMLNSARMTANPALAAKLTAAYERQKQRQELYAERGGANGPSMAAPGMSKEEARAALADQDLIDKARSELTNPNKTAKTVKSYIEAINEKLSKAGTSLNAEKLFSLGPDVQAQAMQFVSTLLTARDKLTKLPVNKATGLPDMKSAGMLQGVIDDTKIKLEKLTTTYESFEDMVSGKFKMLPDKISPETIASLSSSGFAAVMKIAETLDAGLAKTKYNPAKSLVENLANFKSQTGAIKTASQQIAEVIGLSIEDALKTLGIDWQDLFGLKPSERQKMLDAANELVVKEKELDTLRKTPGSPIEGIAAADAEVKRLRATVEGSFASFNALKSLGDIFSSGRFFKLPDATQTQLIELGAEIAKLDKQMADFALKSIDFGTAEGKAKAAEYAELAKRREDKSREASSLDFFDKNIEGMAERLSKLGFNIDPLVIAKLGSDIVDQMRVNLTKLSTAYNKLNSSAPGSEDAKNASDTIRGLSKGMQRIQTAAANMQNFSNSMVSAGSNFVKGILTNTDGAWSGLLQSVTGTIVDNFSTRLGEFLFRDISDSLSEVMFGGELGSSIDSAMWVRDVNGPVDSSPENNPVTGIAKSMQTLMKSLDKGFSNFLSVLGSMLTGGGGSGGSLFGTLLQGVGAIIGFAGGLASPSTYSLAPGATGAPGLSASGGGLGLSTGGGVGIKIPKFAAGGYTGNGGKFEPKGIVHGGEFVINKDATARLGLRYLSGLNSFKGYSSGGLVGGVAGDSVIDSVRGSSAPKAGTNQVINLEIVGDISRQTKSEIYRMLPSIADGVNSINREKGYKS